MKLIPERLIIVILTVLLVASGVYAVSVGQKQIILTLGNNVAFIDGKPTTLEAAPATIKGKTMVPLRFIGEAFGAKVDWDNTTKSATLTLTEKDCQPCPECPKKTIHNLASIDLFGSKSISNARSDLFYIEKGSVKIFGSYFPDIKTQSLYKASVIITLYREDGIVVNSFELVGEAERKKYNECKVRSDLGCTLGLGGSTTLSNIDTGVYYYEVKAVVDNEGKEGWSSHLDELK